MQQFDFVFIEMCGIFCLVLKNEEYKHYSCDMENQMQQRRGPDSSASLCIDNVMLDGHVLWQQGNEICTQPFQCGDIILLLNGDIFNIDHLKQMPMSDTAWLASTLSTCKDDIEICNLLRSCEGPFSLIFYNKQTQNLYFARDSLGRNSLTIEQSEEWMKIRSTSFINAIPTNIMELPPLGLYKVNTLDLKSYGIFPWSSPNDEWKTEANKIENTLSIKISVKNTINPAWLKINNNLHESFNFYELCNVSCTYTESLFEQLLSNGALVKELDTFSILLEKSVQNRVQRTTKYCKQCLAHRQPCSHSKIAILFSGGIDCTILAILVDKYADQQHSIDLINVAFETKNSSSTTWDVPDRCSARDSLTELQQICPSRKWNFIEVNISRRELHDTLSSHIRHLIYPLDTVLDESIGSAFWFASHGNGFCSDKRYLSPARVVIVGTGADELFGGYTRHRNAYNRCTGNELEKEASVHAELEKDWRRIPSRNLARDDRVVGDNGKTLRAPFIEEHLVQYIRCLKSNQRCCFLLDTGIGDKLFLRIYGYRLGLRSAIFLRKRAIQFGSRIANKKQNAADQSEYLKFPTSV